MKQFFSLIFSTFVLNIFSCFASGDTITVATSAIDSNQIKVAQYVYQAVTAAEEKPQIAIKNYRNALISNKVKNEIWEADIRTEMARLFIRIKSKEALPQLLKADALYKKHKNLAGRARALEMVASFYERSGSFANAEKTFNDLIKIQKEQGEAVLAGNVANHLADVYIKKLNYLQAGKYAEMAEAFYYSVCRKDSLGEVYYKIAWLKKKLKSPKTAEFYVINKALPFFSASDNMQGRKKSFEFLGQLYLQQKRFSQAKWFYIQANSLARDLHDTIGTINSLINMGIVKIAIGDLALAKKDLREADQLSKQGNFAYLMKGVKSKYSSMFKTQLKAVPVSASSSTFGPRKDYMSKTSPSPILFAEFKVTDPSLPVEKVWAPQK